MNYTPSIMSVTKQAQISEYASAYLQTESERDLDTTQNEIDLL